MKKKLVLTLATLGAASMLCGFDNTQTAESVLSQMQEVSNNVNAETMTMDMNMDLAVNVSDGETTTPVNVTGNGGFDISASIEPFGMQMEGSFDMNVLGQAQTMTMKMYMVPTEDGGIASYVYTEDSATGEGKWAYQAEDSVQISSLKDPSAVTITPDQFAEWGIDFALAPEAADFNGTECYLLSATVDKVALEQMITKASELTGEEIMTEDVTMVLSLLEGFKMNLEYYVDTATYFPVGMHIDFNGTDLTSVNAMLAGIFASAQSEDGSSTSIELILNDLSVNASMAEADSVTITVPDEALAAVESGEAVTTDSLDDLMAEIEG